MGEPGEVMVPGSPSNVSKNDKGLAKAVLVATYFFNNQSNDAYLFRTSEVEKAQRQVCKMETGFWISHLAGCVTIKSQSDFQ